MKKLIAGTLAVLTLSAQSVQRVGTGIYQGRTVTYEIVDGRAIFQGDIDLGPASALENDSPAGAKSSGIRESVTTALPQSPWPNGIIPYDIDPSITVTPQRVSDAVNNWNNAGSPIRLVARSGEANYVHFVQLNSNGRCSSAVGMAGGQQLIRVDDTCTANALTHEIGHAIGLWHEQSRADRDFHVTVNLANTDKRYQGDHSLQVTNGVDRGGYDYASIMHYTRYEGNRGVQLPIYETIPPAMPLGGAANGISPGDVDGVARLYGSVPGTTTVTTNPPGLQVTVDGETFNAPKAFNWTAGSAHSVDVPKGQGTGSAARYLFGRWADDGAQSHTVVASPDLTVLEVSFIRQYKVTTGVLPSGAGTVSITPTSADGYYDEGSLITVSETPAAGYTFAGWNGTNANFFFTVHGWLNPAPTFRVTIANLAYVAHYTQGPLVTFTTNPPNIPFTVDGNRGSGPRALPGSPGANLTLEAPPVFVPGLGGDQYVFVGWSDGGAATHTVTLPNAAPYPTYTATYKLQHLVTGAWSGIGSVTVSPTSATGYYDEATQVQITATPAAGWQFAGWSRDLAGTTASQSVTVRDQTYALASFQQPFTLTAPGVVNAASFLGGAVSPGEITTLFGWQIGPATLTGLTLDSSGRVGKTLAGTQVLFDGVAAPLVYAAQNQIAAIVPYSVAGKMTTAVQVSLNGKMTNTVNLAVAGQAPAIFSADSSGRGLGAILNQDYSFNSSANPALKGSIVLLYVTGEGQTNPGGVDGAVAGSSPAVPLGPVTVLVGGPKGIGKSAQVLYAGGAPGLVAGVMQINVMIPKDAPSGNVPISFQVGSNGSVEMTTVAIQ